MPSNEVLASAAFFVVSVLAAAWSYWRKPPALAKPDPVLTGVGLEFGSREQTERLIAEVKRIADALTDKNTAGINDALEDQSDRIDRLMTILEGKPVPPRRR